MECIACKQTINDGATKCVHCDTIQNWRRYLVLSQSVLALLLALIAILTVVGPQLYDFVMTKANIRLDLLSDGPAEFTISNGKNNNAGNFVLHGVQFVYMPSMLVTNAGNGSGVITKMCFDAHVTFKDETKDSSECVHLKDEEIVVGIEEARVLRPQFVLKHPKLPTTVTSKDYPAGEDRIPRVGPITWKGTLTVHYRNDVDSKIQDTFPVGLSKATYRQRQGA